MKEQGCRDHYSRLIPLALRRFSIITKILPRLHICSNIVSKDSSNKQASYHHYRRREQRPPQNEGTIISYPVPFQARVFFTSCQRTFGSFQSSSIKILQSKDIAKGCYLTHCSAFCSRRILGSRMLRKKFSLPFTVITKSSFRIRKTSLI
jgi:hypothetical protein